MMNMTNVFTEIKTLLKEYNPTDEFYVLDVDIFPKFVSEVTVPKNMLNGDLWYCEFNFDNITKGLDPKNPNKEYKDRPCLIINDPEFGYIAMRCSSVDPKISDEEAIKRFNGPTKYLITDLSGTNLNRRTYAVINEVRKLDDIYKIDDEPHGHLNTTDFNAIMLKFNNFKDNRFTIIFNFDKYLKFIKYGYKRNCRIQTCDEIEKSNVVSDIDIPNIAHSMCAQNHIDHRILWSVLEKNGKTTNHFTCIFVNRKAHNTYALRYFAQIPGKSESHVYKGILDLERVANMENNWILNHHPFKAINCKSHYLNKYELSIWNNAVKQKLHPDELIDELNQINTL